MDTKKTLSNNVWHPWAYRICGRLCGNRRWLASLRRDCSDDSKTVLKVIIISKVNGATAVFRSKEVGKMLDRRANRNGLFRIGGRCHEIQGDSW